MTTRRRTTSNSNSMSHAERWRGKVEQSSVLSMCNRNTNHSLPVCLLLVVTAFVSPQGAWAQLYGPFTVTSSPTTVRSFSTTSQYRFVDKFLGSSNNLSVALIEDTSRFVSTLNPVEANVQSVSDWIEFGGVSFTSPSSALPAELFPSSCTFRLGINARQTASLGSPTLSEADFLLEAGSKPSSTIAATGAHTTSFAIKFSPVLDAGSWWTTTFPTAQDMQSMKFRAQWRNKNGNGVDTTVDVAYSSPVRMSCSYTTTFAAIVPSSLLYWETGTSPPLTVFGTNFYIPAGSNASSVLCHWYASNNTLLVDVPASIVNSTAIDCGQIPVADLGEYFVEVSIDTNRHVPGRMLFSLFSTTGTTGSTGTTTGSTGTTTGTIGETTGTTGSTDTIGETTGTTGVAAVTSDSHSAGAPMLLFIIAGAAGCLVLTCVLVVAIVFFHRRHFADSSRAKPAHDVCVAALFGEERDVNPGSSLPLTEATRSKKKSGQDTVDKDYGSIASTREGRKDADPDKDYGSVAPTKQSNDSGKDANYGSVVSTKQTQDSKDANYGSIVAMKRSKDKNKKKGRDTAVDDPDKDYGSIASTREGRKDADPDKDYGSVASTKE